MTAPKANPIGLRLGARTLKRLEKWAREEGKTRTRLIREILDWAAEKKANGAA